MQRNFITPVVMNGVPWISNTWAQHIARGSVNPGVDYAAPRGTPILAPQAGVVRNLSNTTGGAAGRFVTIFHDGGGSSDLLHMARIDVSNGQRVGQGQQIGTVGGSAWGSESGVGNHVHWTLRTNQSTCLCNSGNVDGQLWLGGGGGGGPVQPNQRVVGVNPANGRGDPSTNGPVVDTLNPGTVATFNGWIRGQEVQGNNVWFRGAFSGNWFWSGGFTSQSTEGLADLNPTEIGPHQRRATNNVNGRSAPTTNSPIRQTLPLGTVGDFDGWTHGESVDGEDRWIRGAHSGDWFWLLPFEPRNVDNLPEVGAVPPPPSYEFEAFDPVVTRVAPAAIGNFEHGRFSLEQTDVVLHDFGTFGVDTFAGTVAWFQNPASFTSSHFVVSGDNIVQMVALVDRAYHAGAQGNEHVGIEIDPVVGQPDGTPNKAETIASVRALLDALYAHYGRQLTFRLHSEFMVTLCGDDIHFADFMPEEPSIPDDSVPVSRTSLLRWREAALTLASEIGTILGEVDDE